MNWGILFMAFLCLSAFAAASVVLSHSESMPRVLTRNTNLGLAFDGEIGGPAPTEPIDDPGGP